MRTAPGVVCVVMNRGCAAWKGCSSRDFTQNAERAGVFSGPFFVRWYQLQVFAMDLLPAGALRCLREAGLMQGCFCRGLG